MLYNYYTEVKNHQNWSLFDEKIGEHTSIKKTISPKSIKSVRFPIIEALSLPESVP